MKELYPGTKVFGVRVAIATLFYLACIFPAGVRSQGLIFKDPVLTAGSAGQDGATYRFPGVATNADAVVKISGRSSPLVSLVSIDLTSTGFQKAFQPQVSYNGGTTPSGISDWWMEFDISFVKSNSMELLNVTSFDLTGLDIDGNGDKINEWVCFYNLKSYVLEQNSVLQYAQAWELLSGINTLVGEKFTGPVTNYLDIDTTATTVMTTATYENRNSLRLRVGGHSYGASGASDRMYAFWFKSFNFQNPVQLRLPVSLRSFTVQLTNQQPVLTWVASGEKSLNYYLVRRSTNGVDFVDAGYVFSAESTPGDITYSFPDKINAVNGFIYYRLKMVDMDGTFEYSETRVVRIGGGVSAAVQVYPTPAIDGIHITIPATWQRSGIQYQAFSSAGQLIWQLGRSAANQTEEVDISRWRQGVYTILVTCGEERFVSRIIKVQ